MFIAKMAKTKLKKEGFTDKLTRLPDEIWQGLERDANRCRRSVTKQIEAILVSYLEIADTETNGLGIYNAQRHNNFSKNPNQEKIIEDNSRKQTIPIMRESVGANDRKPKK